MRTGDGRAQCFSGDGPYNESLVGKRRHAAPLRHLPTVKEQLSPVERIKTQALLQSTIAEKRPSFPNVTVTFFEGTAVLSMLTSSQAPKTDAELAGNWLTMFHRWRHLLTRRREGHQRRKAEDQASH